MDSRFRGNDQRRCDNPLTAAKAGIQVTDRPLVMGSRLRGNDTEMIVAARVDAGGATHGPVSAENLLVPQGGFEPSTYRLRSDCSAVELLRRPERAL